MPQASRKRLLFFYRVQIYGGGSRKIKVPCPSSMVYVTRVGRRGVFCCCVARPQAERLPAELSSAPLPDRRY